MTRQRQSDRQGAGKAERDQGARTAVTGGKHLDGFVGILKEMIIRMGVAPEAVHTRGQLQLPGYFRPEKQWDVVVVHNDQILAAIELKSQVGPSFGSNFNNRCEEAMGNAFDFWTAWENGAYSASARPWLGYWMLLEDSDKSAKTVDVDEPHFPVLPEFHETSYAGRYGVLLTKLVEQRMYSAACLLLTPREGGIDGTYSEPEPDLQFNRFASSLSQHIKRRLAGEN